MPTIRRPLDGATITLSFPSGRLRWVRCLHLLPDDTPDVADLRAQREERKANPDDGRDGIERLYWQRRYQDALKYEAKPAISAGPLIPKVPRFSSLPTEVL